ncbi:hypothetical protein A2118_00050 [Candidatus Kaiserbacteria bacterium GWA2_50_9]|uniref:Uncharacterized protein n=1 Tax=Candidatus Kaiserbacteria bacterium GWA2_50_9 TaxID=1798474 RepID=A0A1F6BSF8_9BACT|nr:MAG: hypothetical protein A2118_00050 [Candidatus Kaiserbacteria bacterium GWA2_50_9]
MKSLFLGILAIILIGIGGLVYRNAVEHPLQPIACPVDALVCPDGTAVSRTDSSCTFPACPPPNMSLPDIGISFAVPDGFAGAEFPDAASVAAYEMDAIMSDATSGIVVRRYEIAASSTALATIQQTAIGGASGLPVSVTSFTSTVLGTHRFTVVSLERFEGIIDTAYYLARGNDVLRFDAIDKGVTNWTDPNLAVSTLPAHVALAKLLATLQGQ